MCKRHSLFEYVCHCRVVVAKEKFVGFAENNVKKELMCYTRKLELRELLSRYASSDRRSSVCLSSILLRSAEAHHLEAGPKSIRSCYGIWCGWDEHSSIASESCIGLLLSRRTVCG